MYQQVAKQTAIYPREQHYLSNIRFGGEAGEVANKVKKIIRDDGNKINEGLVQEISLKLATALVYFCTGDDIGCKVSLTLLTLIIIKVSRSQGKRHNSWFNLLKTKDSKIKFHANITYKRKAL